ncbi:chlorophyllide reductase [Bradyrhizobium sp. SRS-191]|uniref:chlorophyllide reductase n=1 Tax=Bradyrhizobium sp. SRS-191 TaxID=2962606 RepID=UPI00211DBB2E|nr:chlorophyllide reductase [Bradyrhizobium sp. SRS-191]
MPRCLAKLAITLVAFVSAVATTSPSTAAPSTSRGLISVAQVVQMLEKAPTDRTAQQVLTAYLAGVGEAAGAVASMGRATCRTSLNLSTADVGQALSSAAAGQAAAETPATPLIVRDMLDRAGCKRP